MHDNLLERLGEVADRALATWDGHGCDACQVGSGCPIEAVLWMRYEVAEEAIALAIRRAEVAA